MLPIVDHTTDLTSPVGRLSSVVEPFADRMMRQAAPMRRRELATLQINLGKLCNQTCTHCHVDAGPTKIRENMSGAVADRIIELAAQSKSLRCVDLTGGAPEMNPHFRRLATTFRTAGFRVIDRCNLTILTEPGYHWVAPFLADNALDVIASLPCYLEENVDSQRGRGVFERSLAGLRLLNQLGYRGPDGPLSLDLVYNPTSPSLPPDAQRLEADYRHKLMARYGIEFGRLLTLTNLPVQRYAKMLSRTGQLDRYLTLLAEHFNPDAADAVMCRSLVSISWDGRVFDCDFNQMIHLPHGGPTIDDINSLDEFVGRDISTGDHCYGCTAGRGSGCEGSLV